LRVKFFREAMGWDKGFIEWLSMKRVVGIDELMHFLPQWRDPKSELIILWSCMCITKYFLALGPVSQFTWRRQIFCLINDCEGSGKGLFLWGSWMEDGFFIYWGWCVSLYSIVDASFYALVASRAQSRVLQDYLLRESGICGIHYSFYSPCIVFVVRFNF